MRWFSLAACSFCLLIQLISTLPVDNEQSSAVQPQQYLPQQEPLDTLLIAEQDNEQSVRDKRTINVLRQLFPGLAKTELNPEDTQFAGAESQQNEVRVLFPEQRSYDQDFAATGDNENPDVAESNNAEITDEDVEDPRNKRFLNFGFGGSSSGSSSSGGSGGGSGNFLFDIIRLVANSGNTDSSDSSAGGIAGGEPTVEKDNGYQAGIPGPVTRLFVIANRGIANLIQDLILRIAQTSERIVNFKARLITSII